MGYLLLGSKATSGLCQPLIAMMPPHDTYIETHLGGGAIMRRKPAALHNIGIDRDARALGEFECDYRVELIHGCAHRFLSEYAFEGSELLYSDPPYLRHTRTSKGHKIYPYLLRDLSIERANQAWASDISYIPMAKGFMYLVAIMDWYSRRVLSWRVSNTLDTDFCIEALEEALQRFEAPEIFNTDQGSQFTCEAFTDVLKDHAIAISMDGKTGRWVDNVFVERLWRSVKYEDVYLRAYETPTELRAGLARYFGFYNTRRRHSALDRRTPDAVYFDQAHRDLAA